MKGGVRRRDFARACREVLAGRFESAARSFEAFGSITMEEFGRGGRLESPAPADHPPLYERLASFLSAHPRSAWGHVYHAFALRSQMRYPDSIAACERAVACEPDSPVLLALLARMRFVHRYPPQGVRDLEKAVSLAPESGWARCWLGEARRHQGDLKGALADLDAGLRLDPWYAQAYTWRAVVLEALGRPARAKIDLDRAIRRDPRGAWAYHMRMRLRRSCGDARGALADARAAHALSSKFGWISGRPQETGAALSSLAEAEAISRSHPRWGWAHAWRGWTLLQLGRGSEALDALTRAASSLRHPWVRAWKAQAEIDLSRFEEALRDADAALRLDSRSSLAHGLRGEALRGLWRLRDAESSLRRAVALDPLSAPAFYRLATVQARLRKFKAASDSLDRALEIMPEHKEAGELRDRLARKPPASRETRSMLEAHP